MTRPRSRRADLTCASCGQPIGQREPYYYAVLDCLLYHVHIGCYGRFTERKQAELATLLAFLSAFHYVEVTGRNDQ